MRTHHFRPLNDVSNVGRIMLNSNWGPSVAAPIYISSSAVLSLKVHHYVGERRKIVLLVKCELLVGETSNSGTGHHNRPSSQGLSDSGWGRGIP